MRRITIIGNITADSETREFNGKKVIGFSVAVNDTYKDSQGNKVEKPYYYNCSLWRDNTSLGQYLKRGVKVFIEGSPEVDMYKDKNGEIKANIKITVLNIQLLSSVKSDNTTQTQTQNTNNHSIPNSYSDFGTDDDLPF